MPELPEVEHVVRALRHSVVGRGIVAAEVKLPKLISPDSPGRFARQVKGSMIRGVSRRGKFILIELAGKVPPPAQLTGTREKPARARDLVLAVHLRMTGKFLYLSRDEDLPKHAHAIFYLDNDHRLVFRDQRKFGVMRLVSNLQVKGIKGISELAPEPFGDGFNLDYLRATLSRSRRTLKTLLLDQTKVLGLGNIYAAEVLFRARISPFTIAAELSAKRTARLHTAIQDVLRFAVAHIRGSISL
jgi:formamidopyrimidine-DNA glycosylase